MSRGQCHIEDCPRTVAGRGLCSTHWARWRVWGDPYWVEPKRGQRPPNFRQEGCDVDGCDGKHHAGGFCSRHYQAFVRHGRPTARGNGGRKRMQDPTYAGAHKRIVYDRGRAGDYTCVDCGQPAAEWSLRDDVSPDALRRGAVRLKTGDTIQAYYSVNAQDYDPRCRPCHRAYDGAGDRVRDTAGRFV